MTYFEALLKDPPEKVKDVILEAIIDVYCPGDLFVNAPTRDNCDLFSFDVDEDKVKGCWDCWTTEMKPDGLKSTDSE